MATDIELQELLRGPHERLDVELKNWLDLTQNPGKGNLAKAILALANHGGGFLILGFEDDGSVSPNRPASLDAYSQDAVSDIVDRFADPTFQCVVRKVLRSVDALQYPVIAVPGGHKVPIRSKSGTPGREIQPDQYYIRRVGPASEPPKTAREWDELMRRCLQGHKDELADVVRGILEGRGPKVEAEPDAAAQLERWQHESMERWREVIAGLPADSPGRFPHGWYSLACTVEGVNLAVPQLREAMRAAGQERLTGWTPWWQPTRNELAPSLHDDTIECWLNRDGQGDAAHSDFWRASPGGRLFLIRGYNEDSLQGHGAQYQHIQPGQVFDLTLPVWRVGECLLYAARFAEAAKMPNTTLVIRVEWTGLRGRMLTSLDSRRLMLAGRRSQSAGRVTRAQVDTERVRVALPEIVRDLVGPLFPLFDFFEPPAALYTEEIDRMINRRF